MKSLNIDREWSFTEEKAYSAERREILVNLPHDYMSEDDVTPDSIAGPASGFHNAYLGHYEKKIMIPAEWADDQIYLKFDGVMMNATLEVNGAKVGLQHYGYAPACMDITRYIYPGQDNRFRITTHAGTQPNSRWYSGAGIFRSLCLLHGPQLHIADDGIYAYTDSIDYDDAGKAVCATVKACVEVANDTSDDHTAIVEVSLKKDKGRDAEPGAAILTRRAKIQVNAGTHGTAYLTLTVDAPDLWDTDSPALYRVSAVLTDAGLFKTHEIPAENPMQDEAEILFGIRTVTADIRHGLRINGRTVKLKGGCLHHDNGLLGIASLYDVEYRKLAHMKATGFNAVRTTHNPPSSAFIEAADRLGMYVMDEAFDCWSIGKNPGDYSEYFDTDWQKDLTAFVKRDRSAASVILWSTGNEIMERAGLNHGYTLATDLALFIKSLDMSRPVTNAVCEYWGGLDDFEWGKLTWEDGTEPFVNGLDIVGYNYMEYRYGESHKRFPERIILGSENYPKEIGIHWPMVESTPYVIGDFTWTAYDYVGEAGLGQAGYFDQGDPAYDKGPFSLSTFTAKFPWRTANDADFDINGDMTPQGAYRSVVWGSDATHIYSYDPAVFGKKELISPWGFPRLYRSWNWQNAAGKPVNIMVFSKAEEVELFLNGVSLGRKKVDGKGLNGLDLPRAVLFEVQYQPGEITAVSYADGQEISRDTLVTTGAPAAVRLTRDESVPALKGDGHSVAYVKVEIVDSMGRTVPDAEIPLTATVTGHAFLAGFGSAAPLTSENYHSGTFTTYHGTAYAIIRDTYEKGPAVLTVTAIGFGSALIDL